MCGKIDHGRLHALIVIRPFKKTVFEKVLFLSCKKGKASYFRLIPVLISSDRKSDLVYQIGI